MISVSQELKEEIADLRDQTDDRFRIVFEVLDQLIGSDSKPKKEIGFTVKEQIEKYGSLK